jgi:hypothetical protein
MNPRYALVAARAGHRCEYCHAPEAVFNFPFEIEHVTPLGQSGSDSEENLALACRSCNLFKSDEVISLDPESGENIQLFHPRQQHWNEHFTVSVTDGIVIGLTPSGRATVSRLRMNSTTQCNARRHWVRIGLYP